MTHPKSRIRNYSIFVALFLFVGFLLFGLGEPSGLFAMKMCMLPLYIMATNYIHLHFATKAANTPGTLEFVERFALLGMCFGSFLSILLWTPETPLPVTLRTFFMGGGIFSTLMAAFEIFKKKQTSAKNL